MFPGGLLNIEWIIRAAVVEGSLCTAQGVLKQVGDVAVAFTSLTIAIHTFLVLVLRYRVPPRLRILSLSIPTPFMIIAFIWLFVVLAVAIPAGLHQNSDQPYYTNTGYWCWISDKYPSERIGLEYLWLWAAAFIQIVIYAFLALVLRGIVVVEKGRIGWGKRSGSHDDDNSSVYGYVNDAQDEETKVANARAMQMLFYPLVYLITVFPVSIVRWLGFSDPSRDIPAGATFFASVLFSSSGLLNVILYSVTRPGVVRVRDLPKDVEKVPLNPVIGHPHQLHKSGSSQHMNGVHAATGSSISGSYAERRRTGSLMSASMPLSPVQKAQGRLPDLGDEDEDAESGDRLGSFFTKPTRPTHSSHGRPSSANSSPNTTRPGTAATDSGRTRVQQDDLGRLPDSDDEDGR
ncbi:hypothetical protein ONZ45_g9638 [Pleurotus djamor]|nr:hypothetical protein ONZ45_g9638 [Pleurotus djamor]